MLQRLHSKLMSGPPARPVDYFMLGGMSVVILMLVGLYVHGVRCGL